MTEAPSVLLDRHPLGVDGAVAAVITLNRPDQLNAIDWETVGALGSVLDSLAGDTAVRAVLVTGSGRAFSAGGDLKKYQALQRDPVAFPRFLLDFHETMGRFRTLPVPAVALVNGVAVAGGLELLLACDFAFAARSARIGDGHLNFGQMGGGGVLTILPRLIGLPRATELVLSGRLLPAEEAAEWRLVSRVVDDGDLLAAGLAFAEEIAAKSALAVANAKRVMASIWLENLAVDPGLRREREVDAVYCLTSFDAPEGLEAFAEKRPPRFQGR